LKTAAEYPFSSQVKLVLALTALYNFMKCHQHHLEFDSFDDILGINDDNADSGGEEAEVYSQESQAERRSTSGKLSSSGFQYIIKY